MTAEQFLRKHNQAPSQLDGAACLRALSESAAQGLAGEKGLPMVPSFLAGSSKIPDNGVCAVMDAGGTNLRTALARFRDGKCTLENIRTIPMPGSNAEELSAQAMYGRIAGELQRLGDVSVVGCCFSYLVEIEPNLDGKLRQWCKEIRCPGAEGLYVGSSLRQALPGCRRVVVLNDSTAALLGAQARLGKGTEPFVGLIMGTGVNICYTERREKITKLGPEVRCGDMIISTEAGEFDGITPGTFEREVILSTDNPEDAQAEKQCSGAYLADMIACALAGAVREGILTHAPNSFGLGQVSDFLAREDSAFAWEFAPCDVAFARELCALAVHRAAKIGAVLTAEFVLRSAAAEKMVRIVAEGSLFWKMHGFRELFSRELEQLLQPYGVRFRIERAEGACLEGAALAALGVVT